MRELKLENSTNVDEPATPTWDADDIVLISSLEHWSYCPRQCALIHTDQSFDENIYTLKGRLLHERSNEPETEVEGDVRLERALPLWSNRLGLVGKADVVEFHGETPYPVEYKAGPSTTFRVDPACPERSRGEQRRGVGPRRKWGHDDLQVCAQALCLEEMTGTPVPRGAIYHHGSRRRREVVFDDPLRRRVEEAVAAVRELLSLSQLPPPPNDARCRKCSLLESCLPTVVGNPATTHSVIDSLFRAEEEE